MERFHKTDCLNSRTSQVGCRMSAWKSWEEYRKDEIWITQVPKGGDVPWALFYPADYSVGAASLGYQYVFGRLRSNGIAVERFFLSPIPYRSVCCDTMLERFSVISATIAYEGDVPEFFKWLCGAHIPLSPFDRAKASFPVVGMGGALSYINPLLLSGVCDFIVLGDGMEALDYAAECIRKYGTSEREKLWKKLAEHDEIFVPPVDVRDNKVIRKMKIGRNLDLNGAYYSHSLWMTARGVFGKTLLLELQRGCARSCSYCTLPNCFGKMRFRKFDIVEKVVKEVSDKFEVPQVGLVTPEAGDYPLLPQLLDCIAERNISVSFASLRIDKLDRKMISALSGGGRRSITVAPETGSEALRFSCGKKFTNETIIEKLCLAKECGIDKAKLYFMVGLPGECEEDISAISVLCGNIIKETGISLTLSVNPFIPKPHTPWEREDFIGKNTIRQRYGKIKKDMCALSKKMPLLRLIGVREAITEYTLAWYGYEDSAELAHSIENGRMELRKTERDRTIEALKNFC